MSLSLLSLIPFVFFFRNAKALNDLQDVTNANETMIKNTLSQSFSNVDVLIPFLLGIFIWVSAAVVAAIAINKKQTKGWFGIMSLFLGGLGLHIILSPLVLINKRNKKRKSKLLLYTGASVGLVATVAPVAATLAYNSFEKPVVASPIKFSTNPSSPNLIEIFTDGLDMHEEDVKDLWTKDKSLKDFTLFDKFMTVGPETHFSTPSINGDFKLNNPFAMMKKYDVGPEKLMDVVYEDGFIKSFIDHMNVDKDGFDSRSVINPIGYGTSVSYGPCVSGNPDAIKKLDSNLQVTNWSGARDDAYGKWGISPTSPDGDGYAWLNKNIKVQLDPNSKGARVYIEDMMTHRPFMTNGNGRFTTFNFIYKDQVKFIVKNIKDIIASLSNVGAYDNTMIVVYGDHASHDFFDKEPTPYRFSPRKFESAMMIKYPKQSHVQMETSNRFIYAAQVNKIIDSYFKSPTTFDFNNFYSQPIFNNNLRPIFTDADQYVMAKWDSDTNPTKIVADDTTKVDYDKANLDNQVSALEAIENGGAF